MGGIIFINTDDYAMFCGNKCDNKGCSKHITKAYQYQGGLQIVKIKKHRPLRRTHADKEKKTITIKLCPIRAQNKKEREGIRNGRV